MRILHRKTVEWKISLNPELVLLLGDTSCGPSGDWGHQHLKSVKNLFNVLATVDQDSFLCWFCR